MTKIQLVGREVLDTLECTHPDHGEGCTNPTITIGAICCTSYVCLVQYNKIEGVLAIFCPECGEPIMGIVPMSNEDIEVYRNPKVTGE